MPAAKLSSFLSLLVPSARPSLIVTSASAVAGLAADRLAALMTEGKSGRIAAQAASYACRRVHLVALLLN